MKVHNNLNYIFIGGGEFSLDSPYSRALTLLTSCVSLVGHHFGHQLIM